MALHSGSGLWLQETDLDHSISQAGLHVPLELQELVKPMTVVLSIHAPLFPGSDSAMAGLNLTLFNGTDSKQELEGHVRV